MPNPRPQCDGYSTIAKGIFLLTVTFNEPLDSVLEWLRPSLGAARRRGPSFLPPRAKAGAERHLRLAKWKSPFGVNRESSVSRGPRGVRRSADVIGCVVAVPRLPIGDAEEKPTQFSGRLRQDRAGAEGRQEIAKNTAAARWGGGHV
jgi:hypothetical protein